jgi:hypothetical protein
MGGFLEGVRAAWNSQKSEGTSASPRFFSRFIKPISPGGRSSRAAGPRPEPIINATASEAFSRSGKRIVAAR